MTLNSYRDQSLRDRRSAFVRHPLATALGVVLALFLLLVPVAAIIGRSDGVVIRTARLPGGVIEAAAVVRSTGSTSAVSAALTSGAETTDAPTTSESRTTVKKRRATPTTKATAPRRKVSTTVPTPRTTVKAHPAVTAPPSTAPATSLPPTTMPPTTTTTVPVAYSPAQAEAIIRQQWPDDLEQRAVDLATRESGLRNTVRTWCCYGLFQINFGAHQQWLATVGVTHAEQLYDPVVNSVIALALYQRSGWAPWGG